MGVLGENGTVSLPTATLPIFPTGNQQYCHKKKSPEAWKGLSPQMTIIQEMSVKQRLNLIKVLYLPNLLKA